mmetsp:Transcript_18517/g.57506  ORF Transcript_18517/g.57506 Transcript_18517/m.57506 type:complete len:330 (-) Transcript_18517:430-1419(-)
MYHCHRRAVREQPELRRYLLELAKTVHALLRHHRHNAGAQQRPVGGVGCVRQHGHEVTHRLGGTERPREAASLVLLHDGCEGRARRQSGRSALPAAPGNLHDRVGAALCARPLHRRPELLTRVQHHAAQVGAPARASLALDDARRQRHSHHARQPRSARLRGAWVVAAPQRAAQEDAWLVALALQVALGDEPASKRLGLVPVRRALASARKRLAGAIADNDAVAVERYRVHQRPRRVGRGGDDGGHLAQGVVCEHQLDNARVRPRGAVQSPRGAQAQLLLHLAGVDLHEHAQRGAVRVGHVARLAVVVDHHPPQDLALGRLPGAACRRG